jgi:predicted transcriptional regulator
MKSIKNNPDITYDILIEHPIRYRPDMNTKDIYIGTMYQFLIHHFNIDIPTDKVFAHENMRVHYIDIRFNEVEAIPKLRLLRDLTAFDIVNWDIAPNDAKKMVANLDEACRIIDTIVDTLPTSLQTGGKNVIQKIRADDPHIWRDFMQKTTSASKYTHRWVGEKIIANCVAHVNRGQMLCHTAANELKEYVQTYTVSPKLFYTENIWGINVPIVGVSNLDAVKQKMAHFTRMLNIYHTDIPCYMMDAYVLRRLLDKDYVTHAVVYCGAFHSIDIIYCMVKLFGFTVTHASNTNGHTISELNEKIRTAPAMEHMMAYFPFDHERQCSNVSSFPPDLL